MKKQDESFNAELIRRLRNYSEEPRSQMWQNIITTTDAQRRPNVSHKKSRKGWIFLLGMITVGGLYYFGRTNVSVTSSLVKSEVLATHSSDGSKEIDNNPAAITEQSKTNTSANEITKDHIDKDGQEIEKRATPTQKISSVQKASIDNSFSVITEADNEGLQANDDFVVNNSTEIDVTSNEAAVDREKEPAAGLGEKNEVNDEEVKTVTEVKTVKKETEDVKTVIKEDKKKHNKFSIYFTIMPTFGYQRINSNSSDDIIVQSIDKISAFSTDRLGVRAELGVEDPLTRRIKVFGGLVYFQRKQTINYTEKKVAYTNVSEGPNGEIIVEPVYEYVDKSFEYELKNLGVQLGVSYELSRKKLLQTIGTGFEFHVALNKLEDEYKAEFTNNPSAYVFYNFYYRLQYPAESRLKAVFQPTLNYSFYINQDLNAPFYVKPYGLGLNIGFTYNF